MKTKIKILLLATASLLLNVNIANAQGGCPGPVIAGTLSLCNSSNANTANITTGATTTTYSLTLPLAQGAASTVLTNNGSGTLSWETAAGLGAWSILGNSGTTAGTNFLGTTDVNDLVFKTNNAEKMRVLSGGNVGIGTTTPADKLSVSGGISVGAGYAGSISAPTNGASIQGNVAIGATASPFSGSDKLIITSATAGDTQIRLQSATYTGGSSSLMYNSGSGEFRLTQNDGGPGMVFYTGFGTPTEKMRISIGGNVGIGLTNPLFALDVTGVAGSIAHKSNNTTAWDQSSDIRLKTNITPFTDGLNIVKEINPVNYKYNGKAGTETILQHIGVLAQDIQQVAPYTVGTYMAKLDSTDTLETQLLTFNPHGLFFVLINAVKQLDSTNTALAINDSTKDAEMQAMQTTDSTLKIKLLAQDSMITSLQNQLNQLASVITACCNNNGNNGNNGHGNNLNQSGTNNSEQNNRSMIANDGISQRGTTLTDVELSNKNIVVLNQNIPNPFAEQTIISYFLPVNISHAQILFFEQSGKIIKSVDLTEKGKGALNVFANDLTNGIYTYSLIVDGQTVETKKMVKTK